MEDENPGDRNIRPPRDMKGLLNMAIEVGGMSSGAAQNSSGESNQTVACDPDGGTQLQPLEPNRMKWLQDVLTSVTIDVPQELRKSLLKICADGATADDQVDALDTILDFVVDMNYACDFFKLGGFGILNQLIRGSQHARVRAKCAEVVGELVQNYDFGVAEAKKYGGLETLITVFREDTDDDVKINAFSAISRIVRSSSDDEMRVFSVVHPDVVASALHPDSPARLKTKASFFLHIAFRSSPEVAENYGGCVDNLVAAFAQDSETNTFVLGALSALWNSAASTKYPNFSDDVRKRLDVICDVDQFCDECRAAEEFLEVASLPSRER